MASQEILDLEATEFTEELQAQRLADERRFSPPHRACPYGCDGSGWIELADDVEPEEELDYYWRGAWWTPCECNMRASWRTGIRLKWPRRYPGDFLRQHSV